MSSQGYWGQKDDTLATQKFNKKNILPKRIAGQALIKNQRERESYRSGQGDRLLPREFRAVKTDSLEARMVRGRYFDIWPDLIAITPQFGDIKKKTLNLLTALWNQKGLT